MLQSLQQIGKDLGRDLARGWESLAEGWRDLVSRSSKALTKFNRGTGAQAGDLIPADAPRWSLLSGDVVDTGRQVVVRIELPGVAKEDCEVRVEDNLLRVRGQKRFDNTTVSGSYYLRECAYGAFERTIALPRGVDAERAEAQFANGVLTVRLPKDGSVSARRIAIH